jgi:hypothetical protein
VAGIVQVGGIVVVVMPAAVGAGLGLEGCLDLGDATTEALDHVGQHVVGLEAQPAAGLGGQDLHRHVAVAQVVGGAGEEQRAVGDGLDELLGGGDDLDDGAAVVGNQPVATLQVLARSRKMPPRGRRPA